MHRILLLIAFVGIACSAQPHRFEAELTETESEESSDSESLTQSNLEPVLMDSLKVYGRVIFHDELIDLGDALSLRLKDLGPFAPIHPGPRPYTSLNDDWARIASGEYVKDGRCSDPPSPALALRSIHKDAVGAEISIACKEACVLTVLFRDSEARANGRDYFERVRSKWTLELSGDVQTWANQVAEATFTEVPFEAPKSSGIMGMLSGSEPGPHITVRDVELDAAWGGGFDKKVFEAANEDFGICAQNIKTWRDWWAIRHVLEIDEKGKVSRCESPLPDHLPKSTFVCECAALKNRLDFGPGPVRRVSAYLDYHSGPSQPFGSITTGKAHDPFSRSAYLTEFSGSDPYSSSLGTNALSFRALETCTAKLGVMEQKVPVDFVIDAQGKVLEIKTSWSEELKEFGACADPILKTASFSCPTSATTLTGHIEIHVELSQR